jgi:glycosyltransferase involved in cell wall biosynthesis
MTESATASSARLGDRAGEPLVSVLTATFNSSPYLEETLESALGQSYGNLEVIVADDCSPDDTLEVARAVGGRYPGRVVIEPGSEREGPCRRRNAALARARGSLICWLDGDDLWLPRKVEKQVEVMESEPDVGLVYTGFEAFSSESGEPVPGGVADARSGDLLAPLFVEGDFIGTLTTMFRRAALDRRGGRLRDVEFAYGDDYWAWLSIALDWRIAGIDGVMARYRIHESNLSRRQGNHYLKRIELLDDFLDTYPEARRRLGPARRRGMASHYLFAAGWERENGSKLKGLGYWLRAAGRDPRAAVGAARQRVAG